MSVTPYLQFSGDCEAAFNYYAQNLNGKVVAMSPYEGTPAAGMAPPNWQKKIIHARMTIGDTVLMGSDAPPEHYHKAQGLSVCLSLDSPAEAERAFNALADKGSAGMPMQQTFFAERFGMVTDQFGIPWMVICEGAARTSGSA